MTKQEEKDHHNSNFSFQTNKSGSYTPNGIPSHLPIPNRTWISGNPKPVGTVWTPVGIVEVWNTSSWHRPGQRYTVMIFINNNRLFVRWWNHTFNWKILVKLAGEFANDNTYGGQT